MSTSTHSHATIGVFPCSLKNLLFYSCGVLSNICNTNTAHQLLHPLSIYTDLTMIFLLLAYAILIKHNSPVLLYTNNVSYPLFRSTTMNTYFTYYITWIIIIFVVLREEHLGLLDLHELMVLAGFVCVLEYFLVFLHWWMNLCVFLPAFLLLCLIFHFYLVWWISLKRNKIMSLMKMEIGKARGQGPRKITPRATWGVNSKEWEPWK